jgi:hypothetical protein
MKKFLITCALLSLGSFAAAQDAMEMTPEDHIAKAQELVAQAEIAYPVAFYDRTLYKAAIDEIKMAVTADDSNRDNNAYLAQMFTVTQWWINAYNSWSVVEDLTDQEKDWAALSAAKLAYMALQNGDKATAKVYVEKGMSWKATPSLQAMMKKVM